MGTQIPSSEIEISAQDYREVFAKIKETKPQWWRTSQKNCDRAVMHKKEIIQ